MTDTSVAIQVLPNVPDSDVFRVVDEVIAYIQKSGVKHVVTPFETVLEGDYDELMEIVKQCQLICIKAGAPSVMSYIKIHHNPNEGVWSIEEKTDKYQ